MKNLCFVLLINLFTLNLIYAQSGLKGEVHDVTGPLEFVTVVLYNSKDSSMVKVEYTDVEGRYHFNNINEGSYWIGASFVGLPDIRSDNVKVGLDDQVQIPTILFQDTSNELAEVTVTAQKPLLELKTDKIIMNVAGSINASGDDALTLLRKSPGVVVDNNENILMSGKSGVLIYIDDKPSPLSGTDLAAYLKTLTADQIESIEIITNPSARYDAQGSAGIINIKLLKDKSVGSNGSISTNLSQGEFSRYGLNFSGNHRTTKWNTHFNLGAWQGQNFNINNIYRQQSGLIFDQATRGEGDWTNYSTKFGVDHFINNQHTVGFIVNYSPGNNGIWSTDSATEISSFGNQVVDSLLVSESNDNWTSSNWSANLNYVFSGRDGTKLNLDIDRAKYISRSNQFQPNFYITTEGDVVLSERIFYTEAPKEIDLATAKIDFEKEALHGQLGFGFKYSSVLTDNGFSFFNVINNQNLLDINQSNDFLYDENVAAAYATYSRNISDQISIQAGLRVEHTNSEGQLMAMVESENENVKRKYTDFFPNIGLSYQLDEKNRFNASYSRRLNRPSYEDLNPFSNRLDELTFEQGNPFLNPEYSDNYQISHSWNYRINTTISYTHTQDQITRLIDKADEKSSFITWYNLANQKTYAINISSPTPITQWWNSYTSLTANYTKNNADFDDERSIDLSAKSFNLYSQHTFNLPSKISLEFSGWYTAPSIWGGNIRMKEMYSFDLGVQRSFLDDQLNVKIAVGDIFNTNEWRGQSAFGDLNMTVSGRGDNQRVKLNVVYKFGNNQIKNRQRETGLESEASRIKGEG